MTFSNPNIIEAGDLDTLQTLSLSEEQGVPVVHLAFSLRQWREYSAEPTAFFVQFPSEPKMFYPLHTADTTPLEDTAKREAVQAPQEPAPPPVQPTLQDVETLLKEVESEQAAPQVDVPPAVVESGAVTPEVPVSE